MAHFYEAIPERIRALDDAEAVRRYVGGSGVPGEAIAGLSARQLSARPVPGTWSIQEIVVHLMDSDVIAAYRMKRIIAEEQPALDVWDENAFAARLGYENASPDEACELFRLNRLVTGRVLASLPPGAHERAGAHPQVGSLTLGHLVRGYVHHLDHHMAFLLRKRQMVSADGG